MYLLLEGRSRTATVYLPPLIPRLEAAEGKVLSAEDGELAKSLTGAVGVRGTAVPADDWLGSDGGKLVREASSGEVRRLR